MHIKHVHSSLFDHFDLLKYNSNSRVSKLWVARIQEIFGLQSLLEKIQSGIQKEEEKASCEKSMKEDKEALFKIHENVGKVNSKERDAKVVLLVHKCMEKLNSDWISSTITVDSSTQSANQA